MKEGSDGSRFELVYEVRIQLFINPQIHHSGTAG